MTSLTQTEVRICRAICVPDGRIPKQMATDFGLTHESMKVYLHRIYEKLGWSGAGSMRMLVLWSLAHRAELGIDLPGVEKA